MIVTPEEMRAIEQGAFATGVSAEELMLEVGRRIAARCLIYAGWERTTFVVYAGKGNNAGDALVAAGELLKQRTAKGGAPVRVIVRLAGGADGLGELPRKHLAALPREALIDPEGPLPGGQPILVLDGLLGIGAKGALREPIRSAARAINQLRQERGAYVFAIDNPSGLGAGTGETDEDAVVADETLTIGFAKTGLLVDSAANHVGRLRVIELPAFGPHAGLAPDAPARGSVTTAASLAALLPPRPHESNKGMYGRVGILAGSVGAIGAAVMCSHACARAGAGLITLLVDPEIYPIVAGAAAPEVMVKPLGSPLGALDMGFDVLALGPGLGKQGAADVRTLIARWTGPMIIDADGLNMLSEDMEPLLSGAGPRLLTPHPGEMKRLLHGARIEGKLSRAQTVHAFTERYPVTLLLKGARTLIGEAGRPLAYNSTGNAGMATGGMGDVLTGLCAGLAGQKLSLYDAARLGAWLHGRAADYAVRLRRSEQSLLATDLPAYFGSVFKEIRAS
jgi:NAD(P)H-hydrate epimerase